MSIKGISDKARRAIRNGTGATYTPAQIHELAGAGFLHLMCLLEADELCREAGVEPPSTEALSKLVTGMNRPAQDSTSDEPRK
jgi:hypothetical protein